MSTLVAIPGGGAKPIASLKTGDHILAYDPSTGKASTQTVTATSIHHDDNLVDITLRVSGPAANSATTASTAHTTARGGNASTRAVSAGALAATASASTHDEVVHTTTNHPWLTADHGWLPASFLHLGEPVVQLDGTKATVEAIHAVPGAAAMWDLTVSNVHTFAVGSGEYVVHNCAKTYETYTVTNKKTGEVYAGRTSGTGTPEENIARRFRADHPAKGGDWEKPVLDTTGSDYDATRGREQQLIDYYRDQDISANSINGVGPRNRNYARYMGAAEDAFGRITRDPRIR